MPYHTPPIPNPYDHNLILPRALNAEERATIILIRTAAQQMRNAVACVSRAHVPPSAALTLEGFGEAVEDVISDYLARAVKDIEEVPAIEAEKAEDDRRVW